MAEMFIEILEDGTTIAQAVRRAGDVVSVPGFKPQSKKDQVRRWGVPRYKEISEKEFKERGGQRGESLGFVPGAQPEQKAEEPTEPVSEFAEFEGLNVDETLDRVASLDDDAVKRFISWEQANENRKTVLEPLGVSQE